MSKPPRSLRTELLVGQLSVLLLVVLGFAGSLYGLMRHAIYREAEGDLLGAAQLIAQNLSEGDSSAISIAEAYRHRFGPAPRDHAYFAVWDADDRLITASESLPPRVTPLETLPPAAGPRPFRVVSHGRNMDIYVRGPRDQQVMVGRPLAKESDRLYSLLANLTIGGVAALVVGSLASWWLANRVVRPVEQLTAAAESISAPHLNQRIDLAPASAELHRLASVFNQMLDRLQRSFTQQVRFTADASHELRTPVAIILTQADHTLSRERSKDEYCQALDTCLRAARRMKHLVDDLLLLSRVDAGRVESRREPCDLAEVTRTTVELLAPIAREHDVRLETNLQPAMVIGDPAQLSQVVTNLVVNAIHHSPAGGRVLVTVERRGDGASLSVADNGAGLTEEEQSKVFERFYKADQSRSRQSTEGAGLGLSIVAEIIALHSGEVSVKSTPGAGATFTVEIRGH